MTEKRAANQHSKRKIHEGELEENELSTEWHETWEREEKEYHRNKPKPSGGMDLPSLQRKATNSHIRDQNDW